MEEKKQDRRILKTKKAIRNAYAELISTKNINDITIKDIAETADISRKTFYYYYEGIWAIEEEIENELTLMLDNAIQGMDLHSVMQDPYVIFEDINNIINMDLDFFSSLIINNKNSSLIAKFVDVLESYLEKSLKSQTQLDSDTISIISKYCISGMLAIYQTWFLSDRKQSIEQLSKNLSVIMFDGLNGIINKK